MNFTKPQLKALCVLSDTWTTNSGVGRAVSSLALFHKELVEIEYGNFGPRGGRCMRCRLTPAGLAAKKAVVNKL